MNELNRGKNGPSNSSSSIPATYMVFSKSYFGSFDRSARFFCFLSFFSFLIFSFHRNKEKKGKENISTNEKKTSKVRPMQKSLDDLCMCDDDEDYNDQDHDDDDHHHH